MLTYTLFFLAVLALVWGWWTRRSATFDFFSPMDLDDFERKRIQVYLKGMPDAPLMVTLTEPEDQQQCVSFDPKHALFFETHPQLLKQGNSETIYDLGEIHRRFHVPKEPLVKISAWADSIDWYPVPTIVKARHIYAKTVRNPYAVLLRLRSRVHFGPIQKDPRPFRTKRSRVVWRGGPSGTGFHNHYESHLAKPSRQEALRRWANAPTPEIDLGLTAKWRYHDFKQYLKPNLSISEMLENKYLLSIEGNDVATNLKWALAANSVVMMPRPRVESWFTESLLEPYVHYVPVQDDFSDLYTQKQWCDAHLDECQQIIEQAHAFVKPFQNLEREYYLSFKILQLYLERVTIRIETQKKTTA